MYLLPCQPMECRRGLVSFMYTIGKVEAVECRIQGAICHIFNLLHVKFRHLHVSTNVWCLRSPCSYLRNNLRMLQEKFIQLCWWVYRAGPTSCHRLYVPWLTCSVWFLFWSSSLCLSWSSFSLWLSNYFPTCYPALSKRKTKRSASWVLLTEFLITGFSACSDCSLQKEKRRKALKSKLEMAKFLQDTIEEMALTKKGTKNERVKEFSDFLKRVSVLQQSLASSPLQFC